FAEDMMRTLAGIMVAAGIGLFVSGSALAQDKAKSVAGAALFTSQKCTMCHSVAGKGNPKGSLDGVGAELTAAELKEWIVDPEGMRKKANATRTPAMKPIKLSAEQVDALVAYLQTLKSKAQ